MVIVLFLFLLPQRGQAQVSVGKGAGQVDTTAIRKRVNDEYARRDSMLAAMKKKRSEDSLAREMQKVKIQQYRDSLFAARRAKKTADSLARIEAKLKLMEERRVADSIADARRKQQKDSLDLANAKLQAEREARRRYDDSLAVVRQKEQDAIRLAQKKTRDSLDAIRQEELQKQKALAAYRNSKAYKDSVEAARAKMRDSLKAKMQEQLALAKQERDRVNDSLKLARKQYNDSVNAVRKQYNDSVMTAQKNMLEQQKAERQRINDSLLAERQKRIDSLTAARKKNEKPGADGKPKTNAGKQKALAIKVHEKKKEEWTNEKLLKRKWSLPRRVYQNTVTRYNYYYNAKRKYDEAIRSMTKAYKEDYSKPLSLDPYDVRKQGSSVASFMDTVIKKASFSTQIHDPRSKWFDNLYFLMGRASFNKNDFDGAIGTFQFVANEYMEAPKKGQKSAARTGAPSGKAADAGEMSIATPENRKGIRRLRHHPVRNDALVWLAKSYMMAEQYGEAQSLLNILAKDKNFPDRKKAELYLTKAAVELEQQNPAEAIVALEQALKRDLPDKRRTRMEFLLGQLYAGEQQYVKSTEHLKKSISKKSTPEMDFFTRLKIAENAALGGGDKAYAVNQLEKIIADPKYAKYKSQALNTLAEIERQDRPEQAIALLRKSIANPENTDQKQKALAFAKLGSIYFDRADYELAKPAYDSAAILGSNPPVDGLQEIQVRRDVLNDLVRNIRTIRIQDSMLTLAKKSDKEQRAAAKREIERMKAEKDAQAAAAPQGSQPLALQPNQGNKPNWYFYNNTLMQKGINEFKQKWGTRKLEDNWRRSLATQGGLAQGGGGENEGENPEGEEDADGVSIASLLSRLPKTPAEVDKANQAIQDAYYNLGLTYFSKLSDYRNSIRMFDTLLNRYPQTDYKAQAWYGLYLDYTKLGQVEKARQYSDLLARDFPQSDLTARAKNPDYQAEQKKILGAVFEHYDQTYLLYREGKYREAIDRSATAYASYKGNPILAKYRLVEAISFAGLRDFDTSKALLEQVIREYPNSPEQQRAQDILALLSKGAPGDSMAGAAPLLMATNAGQSRYEDSLEASVAFKELRDADGKGSYTYDPKEEHKVMLFVKNVDGRTMGLKSALSDYNLLRHNVKEYTTSLNLLTAQQAVISIDRFSNAVFARQYAVEMGGEKLLFTQMKKHEYEIALVSVSNFTEMMKTRDVLGYMRFYRKNYK